MKTAFEWGMTILACIGLAIVATSCATVRRPPCVSYCGILIEEPGNGAMSCDVIDEAEKNLIDAIDEEFCHKDNRMCKKNACASLFGWQLMLDESVITYQSFNDLGVRPVVGISNCSTKQMWLGANQNWRHGAFPHEFFHAIQDCDSGWKDDGSKKHGPGHDGWEVHGVYRFIDDYKEGRR